MTIDYAMILEQKILKVGYLLILLPNINFVSLEMNLILFDINNKHIPTWSWVIVVYEVTNEVSFPCS